ncbi:hypothetical protein EDB19DRAFT_1931191 [Suillus lakei]|nr:hypothetical protein EDB19DRAFT_1931191 [Suillus lakei]
MYLCRLCPNCKHGDFPSIEALILHLNSQPTCPNSCTTGTCHPRSGYVFGISKNMLDTLEDDQYAYQQKINHYYPFHDEGEWELGKFLVENLTQMQITKFLKLKWFNTHARLSFTMKDKLLDWMDLLPCFTEWKVSKIEFSGYKTVHPIELTWRDALEVVKQLFSDPILANHMTFDPHHVNVGDQREYGDYMSADMAWKIQDHLPIGATQVPIILGSDKTPSHKLLEDSRCTRFSSPLFHVHPDYQSILQAWLWHKCMDLIFANLKAAAAEGCFMTDPFRYIRRVFTPLVAHVCDLPEATMIAAVAKNASPLTMATQEDFGDGMLYPPFQKAAKALNLSGVHMPYWHDWIYAYPSVFLTGEILHTCSKFFTNHLLKWVKEAVGAYKLDSHFIQMTGREHRDIQCTIVTSIAGAVPPEFIYFVYLTQNPVHSPQSLQAMMQALSDFHSFKNAIVAVEARKGKKGVKDNFFIPKLKLMQSFEGTIRRLGTLMQFSADTTERLLIMHCKDLFPWTARQSKDFTEQCVRILNRQESMEIFDLYALLTSQGAPLVNAIHAEDEEVTTTNPALSWVSHVLPDKVKSGILSGDALTTFQLNVMPDYKSLSLAEIRTKYALPDFDHALTDFIRCSSLTSVEHTHWDPKFGHFQTWNKFQLQLHSAFQPQVIMPSRVVQVYPPSDNFPLGNCDTVLVDSLGANGNTTSYVAQVRLIFQLTIQKGSDLKLPSSLSDPLLYVQFFHFVSRPEEHPELMMWTVERAYTHGENGNCHQEGAVVQVTDVTHAVESIPDYGKAVDKSMSSATCLESYVFLSE